MTILIAIATGLATGLVAWLVTQTFVRPRAAFSEGISLERSDHSPCGFFYRVKMQNVGWIRSITNLSLSTIVVLRHLDHERPGNVIRVHLRTSFESSARLHPRTSRLAAIDPSELTPFVEARLRDLGYAQLVRNRRRTLHDLLRLQPLSCSDVGCERSPCKAAEAAASGSASTRTRRERERMDNYVMVNVVCHDGWTGSEHVVSSRRYLLDDIKDRRFRTKSPRALRPFLGVPKGIRLTRQALARRPSMMRQTLRFADSSDDGEQS